MVFRRKRKYRDYAFNPDEIFMDTLNISDLNQQQFEGVIEKRISGRTLRYVGIGVSVVALVFVVQLVRLQLLSGTDYRNQSEANRLNQVPIFAERGIIYDRNLVELAWNTDVDGSSFLERSYIDRGGYGHLLGYVNYPEIDGNGYYWRAYVTGQDGLEKKYNDLLSGVNGARNYEVDAKGSVLDDEGLTEPVPGENLVTTIDSRIQGPLFDAIKQQSQTYSFVGGAAAVMDISNGELLALVSYPEYDPYTLALGTDKETISSYFSDPSKPFLNRAISGLYPPGSTVKPFLALAALNEGLITDQTTVLSTGRIEIPNPYNPSRSSIFRDWRPQGHGVTNVYHAIADSVNTFFYAIGGGYGSQEGLGISRIDDYLESYGLAQVTGIDFGVESPGTIPSPSWKEEMYADGVWRLGDTYNTSIGQFGFQVSVLSMTRSIAALANGGTLVTPSLVLGQPGQSTPVDKEVSARTYGIVRKAMRTTVTEGTASLLNIPEVEIAAKTGTAQAGRNNEYKNSWAVGFFPFEEPKYAFVLVMERAPNTASNYGSAARAFRDFLNLVNEESPEFFAEQQL